MSCSITIYVGDKTLYVDDINNNGNGSNSGHVCVYYHIGNSSVNFGDDIYGEKAHDILVNYFVIYSDGKTVAVSATYNY